MAPTRRNQPPKDARSQSDAPSEPNEGTPTATDNVADSPSSTPSAASPASNAAAAAAGTIVRGTGAPNPNIGVGYSPDPAEMDISLYEGLSEVYTVCNGGINGLFPDWDTASIGVIGYSGAFATRWTNLQEAFEHYKQMFASKQTVIAEPTRKHLRRLAARANAAKNQPPSSPSSSSIYASEPIPMPTPTPAQRSQYPAGHSLNPIYYSPSPSPQRPAAASSNTAPTRTSNAQTRGNAPPVVAPPQSGNTAAPGTATDVPAERQRHFARRGGIPFSPIPRSAVMIDPRLVEEERERARAARRRQRELQRRAYEVERENRLSAISAAFERVDLLERLRQEELNRMMALEETVNERAATLAASIREPSSDSTRPASSSIPRPGYRFHAFLGRYIPEDRFPGDVEGSGGETANHRRQSSRVDTVPPPPEIHLNDAPLTPRQPSSPTRATYTSSSSQVTPSLNRNTPAFSTPAAAQSAAPSTTPSRSTSVSSVPSKRKTSDAAQLPRPAAHRPVVVFREPRDLRRYPRANTAPAAAPSPVTGPAASSSSGQGSVDELMLAEMLDLEDEIYFADICKAMDKSEARYQEAVRLEAEAMDVESEEDDDNGDDDGDGDDNGDADGDSGEDIFEDALEYV